MEIIIVFFLLIKAAYMLDSQHGRQYCLRLAMALEVSTGDTVGRRAAPFERDFNFEK